jgi:hypothetical protein
MWLSDLSRYQTSLKEEKVQGGKIQFAYNELRKKITNRRTTAA